MAQGKPVPPLEYSRDPHPDGFGGERALMKHFLSITLAIALLLGLGSLAVLARPGSSSEPAAAVAQVESSVQTASQPAAPASPQAGSNYNMIALPLDVQAAWASSTPVIPFTSQGLAQYVGVSSVDLVLRWDPVRQAYDQWLPADGYGFVGGGMVFDPWPLTTGGAYVLVLNQTNQSLTTVSFVGDVPPANTVKFTLRGADTCRYNQVSIPLEQATLTDATALANSMGGNANVSLVLRWDATRQAYDQWLPADGYGFVGGGMVFDPWPVRIGYPYVVCLLTGAEGDRWPQ
jgi:hypothetical protein